MTFFRILWPFNSLMGFIIKAAIFFCLVVALASQPGFRALVAETSSDAAQQLGQHAIEKHGSEVIAAGWTISMLNDCLPHNSWKFIGRGGRELKICNMGDNRWGIDVQDPSYSVDDARRYVTSFWKQKMTRLEQVLQYVRNSGYCPENGTWMDNIWKSIIQ
jgi:hypothetical protein